MRPVLPSLSLIIFGLFAWAGAHACSGSETAEPRQTTPGATDAGPSGSASPGDPDDNGSTTDDDNTTGDGAGRDGLTTLAADLIGTFDRCFIILAEEDELYALETLTILGDSFDYEIQYRQGPDNCSGTEVMRDTMEGTYAADDTGEVTFTHNAAERTILTQNFVDLSNSNTSCGISDWSLERTVSISGLTCNFINGTGEAWAISGEEVGAKVTESFAFETEGSNDYLFLDLYPGQQLDTLTEDRYLRTQ